jgi:hopanoid biosynthesis associated RND transporter like protein HpnN
MNNSNPIRRGLTALVAWVCSRPRLVLALSLLACVASLVGAGIRLRYHTSRNDLLSARKECQLRWNTYLDEFGEDEDIVAVVKGDNREQMKSAIEAIAEGIRQRPELFTRLFYKADLRPIQNRALMLAPMPRLQQISGEYLNDLKPLLDFGPASWHLLGVEGMLGEATQRASRLRPGEKLSPSDERFFAQLSETTHSAEKVLRGQPYESPWAALSGGETTDYLREPQYFFSGDGKLCFLLVRPVKEKGSFTAALASVSAARDVSAKVRDQFPGLSIGLTGLPVLETDEMVAAESDTRLASYIALAGVFLLFIAVYRGLAYPALTVVTLLAGTAWAFGWLTLTIGHLNILSATFAVMLIGMGDYGVLWVFRYEDARRHGMGVEEALLHTAEHVAVGNLTAASTLALAFFAGIFADFKAVAELGWIAGCGVLLCAFACFTVLPSLLMLFDRRGVLPFTPEEKKDDTWLSFLFTRPRLVLVVGLIFSLTVGSFALLARYDHNLLHLQAQGLESVQWETELFEHTAGASWHAVAYTATREEALALKSRLEKLPEVSRVIEVASLVPPDQEAKRPLVQKVRVCLAALPERGQRLPHLTPAPSNVRASAERARAALAPHATDPLLAKVVARLDALQQAAASSSGPALRKFDERLAEGLLEQLHGLRDIATPTPITIAEMPTALRERYIGKNQTYLLRIFAKEDLWDFAPLQRFTHAVASEHKASTGKPFTTLEGLQAMQWGLFRAGLYAFVVIVFVLWLDFRHLGLTLLAVIPLLLGVVLSVAVLSLAGIPLNPANMIAFPLVLGVGVDNGVHVLHDWLIRRREGLHGVSGAIGRGVLIKALTTMIGFAALMLSTERGLVGLGLILSLGVGCSMLAALVLLPAALACLESKAAEQPVAEMPRRLAA